MGGECEGWGGGEKKAVGGPGGNQRKPGGGGEYDHIRDRVTCRKGAQEGRGFNTSVVGERKGCAGTICIHNVWAWETKKQ
jgi:hypothetical protein